MNEKEILEKTTPFAKEYSDFLSKLGLPTSTYSQLTGVTCGLFAKHVAPLLIEIENLEQGKSAEAAKKERLMKIGEEWAEEIKVLKTKVELLKKEKSTAWDEGRLRTIEMLNIGRSANPLINIDYCIALNPYLKLLEQPKEIQ